jgi:membrane fusion protein (multidrug efflux system)
MSDASPAGRHRDTSRRRQLFSILGIVVVVGVILYALYYFLYAVNYESTDDAYVGGDVVSITSYEPGTILALHADNTQLVKRGQLLVDLDPIKPQIAFQAAEANLGQAVRAVRTNFSKVDQLRAQVAAAKVNLATAQSDYRRRASAGSAVSAEELAHARDAVSDAEAGLKAAQSSYQETLAAVQGTNIADNPDVLAAIAALRQAAVVLGHMKLYAPVNGVIAQRTAQLGQQVAPGTPLMAVVPISDVWIDANFKEDQLEDMRIGQPVTVKTDIYGGSVTYHGKVVGLGAGSGSAFALLPPQNASGNWVKIVQRVPVRIALDPQELHSHPLRVGLSVTVSVDVGNTSGQAIGLTQPQRVMQSSPNDGGGPALDALIQRILRQNGA